jgi:hypothetical protein
MGVQLCRGVRRAGIEWRGLPLRGFLGLAKELGSRGLIEAGFIFPAEDANGLKQPKGAKPIGIGGVFRRLKRNLNMRLRRKIIDLVRLFCCMMRMILVASVTSP